MKLLYPNTIALNLPSLQGFPTVALTPYDASKPIPDSDTDAEVLIVWSVPASTLSDAAQRLKNLKWIQSLAAGPNDVFNANFPPHITVTTGSGLHDYTVAEHTLALLLNAARRFFEMRDYQLQGKWPGHLGGTQEDRPKGKFTSLRGANVVIWGFGNIAKKLVPMLVGLGANVKGVARSSGVRDGVEVVGEEGLETVLREADALVMILPGVESTKKVLNRERIGWLQKHAWLVNVGRGTTVDEEALADALDKGEIGGAALDVFEKEPLPEGSRLWKTPNTIVSPHAAGGRPQGAEALIVENLRRFLAGQELKNVV